MANDNSGNRLPSHEELAKLPRACIVAYAARCALRAVPVLGRGGRLPEPWGAQSAEHGEAVLRAVQAALATCTARAQIFSAAAARAVYPDTDLGPAAARAAARAAAAASAVYTARVSYAARTASAAVVASAAAARAAYDAARAAYHDDAAAAAAAWVDYEYLRDSVHEVPSRDRVPVDFFARPLWGDERSMAEWSGRLEEFMAALRAVGLEQLAGRFVGWTRGAFDPEELARDFNEWAERPKRGTRSAASSPAEPRESAPESPERASEPDKEPASDAPPADGGAPSVPPPSSPEPVAPEIRRVPTVETHFAHGGTAGPDRLDRRKLAAVLASFLRDPRTETPLTLSIEGRWGSGKTKFMGLLDEELAKSVSGAAAKTAKRVRRVEFNPWRYQTHEELWAAFALKVLNDARAQLPWWRRIQADAAIARVCMDWGRFRASAARLLLGTGTLAMLLVVVASFVLAGWSPEKLARHVVGAAFLGDLFGVPRGLVATVLGLGGAAAWVWKQVGRHLPRKLEVHLNRPDYAARTSFLEGFHEDFARAVKAYAGGDTLVVFIDDLDRCDVPKAAELMQGINLMLGDDVPLIYVLGMDRAKVAAGIAVKHRELLPFLYAPEMAHRAAEPANARELPMHGLAYGYEFIEKFIQLPFRLPLSTEADLGGFILGLLARPSDAADQASLPALGPAAPDTTPDAAPETKADDPTTAKRAPGEGAATPRPEAGETPVARVAPSSPPPDRRAEGTIEEITGDETFLAAPLTHAAGVLDGNPRRIKQLVNLVRLQRRLLPLLGASVTDGQLAKWTAVALRWPVFLVDLEQERGLLEALVARDDPPAPSGRYLHWNGVRELVVFLRGKGPGAADADHDLTRPGVVAALLRLGVAVPVAETAAAAVAAQATKAGKGSGDGG